MHSRLGGGKREERKSGVPSLFHPFFSCKGQIMNPDGIEGRKKREDRAQFPLAIVGRRMRKETPVISFFYSLSSRYLGKTKKKKKRGERRRQPSVFLIAAVGGLPFAFFGQKKGKKKGGERGDLSSLLALILPECPRARQWKKKKKGRVHFLPFSKTWPY